MTVAEILDDVKKRRQVREFKSACCGAPVNLVYQTLTSARVAIVVTCTKCDRLHAFDSRDDDGPTPGGDSLVPTDHAGTYEVVHDELKALTDAGRAADLRRMADQLDDDVPF